MEYLDPKLVKRHHTLLLLGYGLIIIAIGIATRILLWEAYGYGLQNGKVVQSSMIFLSSQPNPASIYINGKLNSATTNSRLTIPAGAYKFKLTAPGYRSWNHVMVLLGGTVVHYDYPLLFPIKLSSTKIAQYSVAPEVVSQSPSRQYLLVSSGTNFASFHLYDLTNPTAPPVNFSLPSGLLSSAQTTQSWQVVGWANDNQHILMDHLYDGTQEFIEIDTQNPTQSININKTFAINPTSVSLDNLAYNQFYFYDATTQTISSGTIGSTAVSPVLSGVVAFDSYQSNTIIYATQVGAPSNQVAVKMEVNGTSYLLRNVPIAQTYLLNDASYNGNDYVVVGDSSDNYVYIYENPLSQISSSNSQIYPFRAMTINDPTYDSFAPTAQFILAENNNSFAIYDIYNDTIYHYDTKYPLQAPQQHVQWMDGDRLVYVSNDQLIVSDYDNTNRQILNAALPQYLTFFAPNYLSYFNLSTAKTGGVDLMKTSLVAS